MMNKKPMMEDENYKEFFQSALKKFKVSSPADFKSDEEKKKFFDYVDKNYKAKDEDVELDETSYEKDMSTNKPVVVKGVKESVNIDSLMLRISESL